MNRGQAIARIQEKLGFSTALSSNIASALQDAQSELERDVFLPKFLAVYQEPLVTVAAQETVPLPTGFLREAEDDGPLWYQDAELGMHELYKDDMWYLRQTFIGDENIPTTTVPSMYALGATALHIFPLPDAVYNLKFSFYKAAETLASDGIENAWLIHAHDLLIGMAGKRIAEAKRDMNGIVLFTNMEAAGKRKLINASEAREHEGRRYVMGGDD